MNDAKTLATELAALRAEVDALLAERAVLLKVLKGVGLFLHHCWCDVQMNEYSFGLLNQQMRIVDAAINAAKELQRSTEEARAALAQPASELMAWVSVSTRLPELDTPVLVHNGRWTGVGTWRSGDLEPTERWQDEHGEFIEQLGPAVTHWMPLPAGPAARESLAQHSRPALLWDVAMPDEVARWITAHPPRILSAERVPLTDEQIASATSHVLGHAPGYYVTIARAIERAHGIGEPK